MGLLYSSMLYPTNPDYEVPSALQNETTTGMISRPYLDHTYNPQGGMDLDIVVSMYKEDPVSVGQILDKFRNLEVFKTLNPRVLIYVKNKNANITMIKKRTGASSVELLPNKGREGGTYLHHILTEWDNLANHTLFIQGGVHEMKATMNRIQDFFMPKTGMLSLGFRHATCNCDSCKDPWTSPDLWPRVPEIYSAVYRETCQNNTSILISYAGQFLASAKRIRGTSKAIYKHLSDLVESDSEHWIHQDSHDARFFDTMDNPYFGHTIERSWMIVLQCSEPRLAERCQDLNLRRVEGDSDDICQCIDAE